MQHQAHAAQTGILKVVFHTQKFNLLPVLLEEMVDFSSVGAPLVPTWPSAATHPLHFTGHYLLCSSSQRPAPTSDCFPTGIRIWSWSFSTLFQFGSSSFFFFFFSLGKLTPYTNYELTSVIISDTLLIFLLLYNN